MDSLLTFLAMILMPLFDNFWFTIGVIVAFWLWRNDQKIKREMLSEKLAKQEARERETMVSTRRRDSIAKRPGDWLEP